jgi:hypothetical protein
MSLTHSPVQTKKESIFPWSTLTWSYDGDIYPSGLNALYWEDGNLNFSNDTIFPITSGSQNITDTKYLFWEVSNSGIFQFGNAAACIGNGLVPIGVAIENLESGQQVSLRVFQGPGLNITADNIATNTLSAISADMGTVNAGIINGVEINGSTVTGGIVQTSGGTGQRIVLSGADNRLYFYDDDNEEIIRIGENILGGNEGIKITGGAFYCSDINSFLEEYSLQYKGGTLHLESSALAGPSPGDPLLTENIYVTIRNSYDADLWCIRGRVFNLIGDGDTPGNPRNRIGLEGSSTLLEGSNLTAIGLHGNATHSAGTAIAIKGTSSDINLRLVDNSNVVDFRVDSGYLDITPTGDRIRLWESARGAGDYSDLWTNTDGELNIQPNGTGATQTGKMILWDAPGISGVEMYSDIYGGLRINPGGIATNNISISPTIGSSMHVVSYSDTGTYTGTTLSNIPGYRISNTFGGSGTGVGTSAGIHFTCGVDAGGYAGIWGEREGNNQQSLNFYTENTSRSIKFKISHDGALEHMGSEIITTTSEQTGNFKTRQTLLFGRDAALTQIGGTNTVDATTIDSATNTRGYRMIRAGTVTGVSLQFNCTNATTIGLLTATVQDGGTNTTMAVTYPSGGAGAIAVSNDLGHQSTSNSFSFSAGDRINVELSLLEVDGDSCTVDDIAVIVEFIA